MVDDTANLDTLMAENTGSAGRRIAWAIMILLSGAVGWTYFAHLDEVASAQGEVIPQSQIKVIQHLEGGIVQEIYVKAGDSVKEGDSLILLNLASSGLNREELQARLDGLLIQRARLAAEARATEPEFPAEAAGRQPELVNAERATLEARRGELQSTISVQNRQIQQRQLEIQEAESRQKSLQNDIKLAREKLTIYENLVKDALISRVEYVEQQRTVEQLQGEVEAITHSIPRAQAAMEEARERARELQLGFRREAQNELGQVELNIARTRELLAEASEQRQRALIKSPIDGIIKNVGVNTIGGVVQPGQPIMEVVPTDEKLVVEAKLNPVDRGYVREGQPAMVKVSSYDFVRYGGLRGQVTFVAADSDTDEKTNEPFYRVVVQTDRAYLGTKEGDLPITPGMQATVDIQTGSKSVLEYLIKPVLKIRYEAFRER
jgi:adhesin transport system membrane fusion protein